MSEKVQIKISRNTMAEQKPVKIGDVLTLDAREATTLINMKRAVIHTGEDEKPEPENTPAPAAVSEPAPPAVTQTPPPAEPKLSKKAAKKAAAAAKAAAEADKA